MYIMTMTTTNRQAWVDRLKRVALYTRPHTQCCFDLLYSPEPTPASCNLPWASPHSFATVSPMFFVLFWSHLERPIPKTTAEQRFSTTSSRGGDWRALTSAGTNAWRPWWMGSGRKSPLTAPRISSCVALALFVCFLGCGSVGCIRGGSGACACGP